MLKKLFKFILWTAALAAAIPLAIVAVALFYADATTERPAKSEKPAEMTEADYAQIAKETCRLYIKQVLNDPDSAEWTRISEWRVETDHEGTWAVYATLRAKNGFGAKVLSTFRCEMFGLLGNFELRDLKEVH